MYTRNQATHIRIVQGLLDKSEAHVIDAAKSLRRIIAIVNKSPELQTERQADRLEGNVRRGAQDSHHTEVHAQDAARWLRHAKRSPKNSQYAVEGASRSAAGAERGARGVLIELSNATDTSEQIKINKNEKPL